MIIRFLEADVWEQMVLQIIAKMFPSLKALLFAGLIQMPKGESHSILGITRSKEVVGHYRRNLHKF
jgi:hypothetical protein